MPTPLTREEVKSVIEGRGCAARVPIMFQKWVGPNIYRNTAHPEHGERLRKLLSGHPQDVAFIRWCNVPVWEGPEDDPDFRWMNSPKPEVQASEAPDAMAPLSGWAMLDDILAKFPSADYPGLLPSIPPEDGRYRAGHWWYNYFERHWQLRGMTNALMDYYTNPDEVHRLFDALTEFYLGVMRRMKAEGADAIYVTDDLGTQTGPFFPPDIFEEFYVPYYKKKIDAALRTTRPAFTRRACKAGRCAHTRREGARRGTGHAARATARDCGMSSTPPIPSEELFDVFGQYWPVAESVGEVKGVLAE